MTFKFVPNDKQPQSHIGQSAPDIGCFQEVRELLQELVTPSGYHFWGESLVTIDGVDYPLDELTKSSAVMCWRCGT